MIELLGGLPRVCDDTSLLPRAAGDIAVTAESSGFVTEIRTVDVGRAAMVLGAGRATKSDAIDPAVGLKLNVRRGDRVRAGDEIGRLFVNDRTHAGQAEQLVQQSVIIGETQVETPALIYRRIGGE